MLIFQYSKWQIQLITFEDNRKLIWGLDSVDKGRHKTMSHQILFCLTHPGNSRENISESMLRRCYSFPQISGMYFCEGWESNLKLEECLLRNLFSETFGKSLPNVTVSSREEGLRSCSRAVRSYYYLEGCSWESTSWTPPIHEVSEIEWDQQSRLLVFPFADTENRA